MEWTAMKRGAVTMNAATRNRSGHHGIPAPTQSDPYADSVRRITDLRDRHRHQHDGLWLSRTGAAKLTRELENTVLLLPVISTSNSADFDIVQQDIINRFNLGRITSPEDFRREMSGDEAHQMLKSRTGAFSYLGNLTLLDSEGDLSIGPLARRFREVNFADRAYFHELKSNASPDQKYVDFVHSRVSGRWTTILSRRLAGRNGEFLGILSRGLEPIDFEKFFESLTLGKDAAISMLLADGTLIARFPHLESRIGQNFSSSPMIGRALSHGGRATAQFTAQTDGTSGWGPRSRLKISRL